MFKRALQANHWMAIGLDNWNELENQDITLSRVRKMRLAEKKSRANPEEESDVSDSASIMSEVEESVADVVSTSDVSDSEVKEAGTFVYCEICPGRKFLTGKDIEDHLKSKQHLKKLAAGAVVPTKQPTLVTKSPKPVVQKHAPSTSNRKARRAGVLDTRQP